MAALGFIGEFANTIGGTVYSAKQQKSSSSRSRNWQRHVAKNKHSWEIESLKKAGLNPILAAGVQPNPGANPPPMQVPDYSKIGDATPSPASALSLKQSFEEVKRLQAAGDLLRTQNQLESYKIPKAKREAELYGSDVGDNIVEGQEAFGPGPIGEAARILKYTGEGVWDGANWAAKGTQRLYHKGRKVYQDWEDSPERKKRKRDRERFHREQRAKKRKKGRN